MLPVVRFLAAPLWRVSLAATLLVACTSSGSSSVDGGADPADAGADPVVDAGTADALVPDAHVQACVTPSECAAIAEGNAAARLDAIVDDPAALTQFLRGMPKGGDLHNHLSGAVYAETYLDWARSDGNCINSSSYAAVASGQCSTTNVAVPLPGMLYDLIVGAWSMEGFVPGGAQSGHDHFFATFGKYGAIAGAHRDDSLADVATRAADENQLYVETMFNLGKNVGTLASAHWSGTLTAADLPTLYAALLADPAFASTVASDVAVVTSAAAGYRATLGCDEDNSDACDVTVRFIAQVSRTGANDVIFGQLVSAFEMARTSGQIVGANLSSPEDDSSSINNYDLHMAMLDFLYQKYTATGVSPLQITLHAGELTAAYLPRGSTANTFHIRKAVQVAHAVRIGHGLDVMSETDPMALLDEMAERQVLVEVCLSSNEQILEVSGTDHPLAQYLAHGVPVTLATDDQGVSRSSMAGEYRRAVLDQHLDYRQLKTIGRQSLEHAFLPGASLWISVTGAEPVAACAPTATMGLGDVPDADCQTFLATSARARMQWELERRYVAFDRQQPAP
jgi:adenosine deaminase